MGLCLKDDLIVKSQIDKHGSIYYLIKDPTSHSIYRMGEIEFSVLKLLNGEHSPSEIHLRILKDRNVNLPPESISNLLAQARVLNLVRDKDDPDSSPSGIATRREERDLIDDVLKNPFFIRIVDIDPDRFLSWAVTRLKVFFSIPFLTIATLFVLAGMILLGANFSKFYGESFYLISHFKNAVAISNLFWFYLIVLVVISIHEFAHGLTCKYFGGSVTQAGYAFVYLIPSFFCKLTDSWLFDRRSHRIWVSLAGVFAQLIIWSLFVFLWFFSAPPSVTHQLALLLCVFFSINSLINLIPLIKTDGYYALCEYLDIPNLRAKSFNYFFISTFGRIFGVKAPFVLGRREQRIFLIYGATSLAFTTLVLIYVFINLYKLLGGGPIFFAITAVLLFIRSWNIAQIVQKHPEWMAPLAAAADHARAYIRPGKNKETS